MRETIIVKQRVRTKFGGVYESTIHFIDGATGATLDAVDSEQPNMNYALAGKYAVQEATAYLCQNYEFNRAFLDSDVVSGKELERCLGRLIKT